MKKLVKSWFDASKTQTYIFLIVIAYAVFVSIVSPNFLSLSVFLPLIRSTSWIWILALGAFLVILSGGVDLSFTSIAIASMYIALIIIKRSGIESLTLAFIIAIIAGMSFGAINGLIIHFYKLPTIIVTLGTKTIFIGIMAAAVGVEAINTEYIPDVFKNFGLAHLFRVTFPSGSRVGLTVFIVPLILLVFLTWFILYYTSIGRGIVAMGNSAVSAELVGYNLLKIRMFLYVYVGMLSAVAGIIALSDLAWIAPLSSTIIGYELTIIAAVVIGGTRLAGGKGTIFGTIIGVLLVRLFETTLIFIGLSTSWNNFFTGLVFLGVLTWTSIQRHFNRRRMLLFVD